MGKNQMKTNTNFMQNITKNTLFTIILIISVSLISSNSLAMETDSITSNETEQIKQSNIPTGWFNIVGKTGLCVAARNNNGILVPANCGNVEDLLWKTDKSGNGLKITNKTKRQMDSMGSRMLGYVKQNTPRQIWAIDTVNNGKYVTFRNVSTKKCLEANEAKNNGSYKITTCDAYSE